jgi:hypothetical protein
MKVNFKLSFRQIWLAIGIFSLILLFFLPPGADANNPLRNAMLVANVLLFVLSLPCSLFAVPVVAASAYYLDMHPTTSQGITLSTILLFVIGLMQWFWIARFWSPVEPPLQMLNLPPDGKTE